MCYFEYDPYWPNRYIEPYWPSTPPTIVEPLKTTTTFPSCKVERSEFEALQDEVKALRKEVKKLRKKVK